MLYYLYELSENLLKHGIENDFVKVPDFNQFQAEFSKWAGDFGRYFVKGKAPGFDLDVFVTG